jgi:hypothetical protein
VQSFELFYPFLQYIQQVRIEFQPTVVFLGMASMSMNPYNFVPICLFVFDDDRATAKSDSSGHSIVEDVTFIFLLVNESLVNASPDTNLVNANSSKIGPAGVADD